SRGRCTASRTRREPLLAGATPGGYHERGTGPVPTGRRAGTRRRDMRKLRCVGGLALLGAALLGGAAVRSGETPRVEVKEVKYAGLGDLVRQNRGKVVVLDFWATYCLPCKREFPHLVGLHKKYARD